MEAEKDSDQFQLKSRKEGPRDLLTLLRFSVMTRLSSVMFTRQFISRDSQCIYVVAKTRQQQVEQMADRQALPKQLELGAIDLLSLEPVDQDLRPLRLKAYVRNFQLVEQDYQAPESAGGMANLQRVCRRAYLGFSDMSEHDF